MTFYRGFYIIIIMDRKKCPRCGHENLTSKSRCDNCGNILPLGENEILCPKCGTIVNKSASYCGFCGFPVKAMGNTRLLLRQIKEAEKSYKTILKMNKKEFIEKLCSVLSSGNKEKLNDYERCLKDADIRMNERDKQRGIHIYPIAVVVQDDKWDRFCELSGTIGSRGFNIDIQDPLFRGIRGISFVKHEYQDAGTLSHEQMHSSFRIYHSHLMEKYRKEARAQVQSEALTEAFGKDIDKKITLDSPKLKFISHSLLNELNSWRSNVEKDKLTWPEVYTLLAFGYLPPLLEIFPEIYNDIKDLNIEKINEYAGTERGKDFNSFLHMIWDACLTMQELEKIYDKWVIDRFLAKCDQLTDVIFWKKHKDWFDSRQAREGKKRQLKLKKQEKPQKSIEDLVKLVEMSEKSEKERIDRLAEIVRKGEEERIDKLTKIVEAGERKKKK